MKKLEYIMKYYKIEHMIKFYIVGLIIASLSLFGIYNELEGRAIITILFTPKYFLFYSVSTLFYPFTMGVYLEFKYKIFRSNSLFTIIIDVIIGIILFLFSIPIGMIKILLIYFSINDNTGVIRSDIEYKSQDKSDDITW